MIFNLIFVFGSYCNGLKIITGEHFIIHNKTDSDTFTNAFESVISNKYFIIYCIFKFICKSVLVWSPLMSSHSLELVISIHIFIPAGGIQRYIQWRDNHMESVCVRIWFSVLQTRNNCNQIKASKFLPFIRLQMQL